MRAIKVCIIIATVMSNVMGQVMNWPPMFMAMGNMNPRGGMSPFFSMVGDPWSSFGQAFKNMAEAFKNMRPIQSWHTGENVCSSETFRDDPFSVLVEGKAPAGEYETCRENGFKLVCVTNMFIKGKAQERVRVYQCCPRFVGVINESGKKCVPAV